MNNKRNNVLFVVTLFLLLIGCANTQEENEDGAPTFTPAGITKFETWPILGMVVVPNTAPNVNVFEQSKPIAKIEYPREIDPRDPKGTIDMKVEIDREGGWILGTGYRLDVKKNEWVPFTLTPRTPEDQAGAWIKNYATWADEVPIESLAMATGFGKEGVEGNAILLFSCKRVQTRVGARKEWKCGCEKRDEIGRCMKWIKQDFTIETTAPVFTPPTQLLQELPSTICRVPKSDTTNENAKKRCAEVIFGTEEGQTIAIKNQELVTAKIIGEELECKAACTFSEANTIEKCYDLRESGTETEAEASAGESVAAAVIKLIETKNLATGAFTVITGRQGTADATATGGDATATGGSADASAGSADASASPTPEPEIYPTERIIEPVPEKYTIEPQTFCPADIKPDFEIARLRLEREEIPPELGEPRTIFAYVENNGLKDYIGPFKIDVYEIVDEQEQYVRTIEKEFTTTEPFRIGLRIPFNVGEFKYDVPGIYQIKIVVDKEDFVDELEDEANNEDIIILNIQLKPDFTIELINPDPVAIKLPEGQTATEKIPVRIKNLGAQDYFGPLTIQMYSEEDPNIKDEITLEFKETPEETWELGPLKAKSEYVTEDLITNGQVSVKRIPELTFNQEATHTINVIVDLTSSDKPIGDAEEIKEDNNELETKKTIQVLSRADLTITEIITPLPTGITSFRVDENIPVRLTIKNIGVKTATGDIKVKLQLVDVNMGTEVGDPQLKDVTLNLGFGTTDSEITVNTAAVKPSQGHQAGVYKIVAYVDAPFVQTTGQPEEDIISELDDELPEEQKNNQAETQEIVIEDKPELSFKPNQIFIVAPGTVTEVPPKIGENLEFVTGVENTGTETATDVRFKWYLVDEDGNEMEISETDYYIQAVLNGINQGTPSQNTQFNLDADPRKQIKLIAKKTFTADDLGKIYTIKVVIDSDGMVEEFNEENNELTKTQVQVVSGPDLEINEIILDPLPTGQTTYKINDEIKGTVKIKNIGGEPAQAPTGETVQLSIKLVTEQNQQKMSTSINIDNLNLAQNTELTPVPFTLTLAGNLETTAKGNYRIIATVDPIITGSSTRGVFGIIDEYDETQNNQKETETFEIQSKPELEFLTGTQISITKPDGTPVTTPKTGQDIEFTTTITNTGTETTTNAKFKWYLIDETGTETQIPETNYFIQQTSNAGPETNMPSSQFNLDVYDLVDKKQVKIITKHNFPTEDEDKTYTIKAVLDPTNEIEEFNEQNNELTKTQVQIVGAPDLQITNLEFMPLKPFTGQDIIPVVTITNSGETVKQKVQLHIGLYEEKMMGCQNGMPNLGMIGPGMQQKKVICNPCNQYQQATCYELIIPTVTSNVETTINTDLNVEKGTEQTIDLSQNTEYMQKTLKIDYVGPAKILLGADIDPITDPTNKPKGDVEEKNEIYQYAKLTNNQHINPTQIVFREKPDTIYRFSCGDPTIPGGEYKGDIYLTSEEDFYNSNIYSSAAQTQLPCNQYSKPKGRIGYASQLMTGPVQKISIDTCWDTAGKIRYEITSGPQRPNCLQKRFMIYGQQMEDTVPLLKLTCPTGEQILTTDQNERTECTQRTTIGYVYTEAPMEEIRVDFSRMTVHPLYSKTVGSSLIDISCPTNNVICGGRNAPSKEFNEFWRKLLDQPTKRIASIYCCPLLNAQMLQTKTTTGKIADSPTSEIKCPLNQIACGAKPEYSFTTNRLHCCSPLGIKVISEPPPYTFPPPTTPPPTPTYRGDMIPNEFVEGNVFCKEKEVVCGGKASQDYKSSVDAIKCCPIEKKIISADSTAPPVMCYNQIDDDNDGTIDNECAWCSIQIPQTQTITDAKAACTNLFSVFGKIDQTKLTPQTEYDETQLTAIIDQALDPEELECILPCTSQGATQIGSCKNQATSTYETSELIFSCAKTT